MIRNRYTHFLHLKQSKPKHQPYTSDHLQISSMPYWFEQFYNHKENLKQIQQNSNTILRLTESYERSPTVYSLKQLERLIDINATQLDKLDKWINQSNFGYMNSLWNQILKNIKNHFALQMSKNIMVIFQARQRIQTVDTNIMNQSYNTNNLSANSPNFNLNSSYNSHNISQGHDFSFTNQGIGGGRTHNTSGRQEQFNHVSHQISNLNNLLKRMNTVLIGQGQLINRIDENIQSTHTNMKKGRAQLQKRLDKQNGQGQFSIYGRINKAIMSLYIVNVILILIFLLKNIV